MHCLCKNIAALTLTSRGKLLRIKLRLDFIGSSLHNNSNSKFCYLVKVAELNAIVFLKQVIRERRRQKTEGSHSSVKKDLLDLLMDMHDEETDSRMNDEELRSQV